MKGQNGAARRSSYECVIFLGPAPARSVFEKCGEVGHFQTVKHPLLRHAAFPRHFYAPVREINLMGLVGVYRNRFSNEGRTANCRHMEDGGAARKR